MGSECNQSTEALQVPAWSRAARFGDRKPFGIRPV